MRFLTLALLGMWLCVTGCDHGDRPPLGAVHGAVTLDGAPLPNAQIFFFPEKGRPSCGETDAAGHYELFYLRKIRGAMIGRHKIVIQTVPPEEFADEKVPARYNRDTSLHKEVVAGDNEFDFSLASK